MFFFQRTGDGFHSRTNGRVSSITTTTQERQKRWSYNGRCYDWTSSRYSRNWDSETECIVFILWMKDFESIFNETYSLIFRRSTTHTLLRRRRGSIQNWELQCLSDLRNFVRRRVESILQSWVENSHIGLNFVQRKIWYVYPDVESISSHYYLTLKFWYHVMEVSPDASWSSWCGEIGWLCIERRCLSCQTVRSRKFVLWCPRELYRSVFDHVIQLFPVVQSLRFVLLVSLVWWMTDWRIISSTDYWSARDSAVRVRNIWIDLLISAK